MVRKTSLQWIALINRIVYLKIPGEELGLIESQEAQDNQATISSTSNEWSSSSIERGLVTMDRKRKSTVNDAGSPDTPSDDEKDNGGFALGLVKSNSVVARASMWQQLQQQAKGDYSFVIL